jgi:ribosomal protein S18 acetylase RimI-like enzyme
MPDVALRPAEPQDRSFLERVYASTRAEELAPVPWSDAQKAAFLHMQFEAQDKHYRQFYGNARFDLIIAGEQPIGRIYVERAASEIRLIDIALLPEHRGAGIGGALIAALIAEARAIDKPITLYVERDNPAQRLYRRLGFSATGEEAGVYMLLKWQPASATPAAT